MSLALTEEEGSTLVPLAGNVAALAAAPAKGSYGQILKSSAIVGGSSLLNIVIGIIRTKMMALLLGPTGFGLLSVFGSIVTLTQTLAGMGVNSSGVRQIAEAAGSDDALRITRTSSALRRLSLLLGGLGALALILFSRPISQLTFGTPRYAGQVSGLSIAAFFAILSAGQGALINGLRRIADLARMNVLGASLGMLLSVPVVYILRERGVVPALVLVSATTWLASWWYSRKARVPSVPLSASTLLQESKSLLKLGIAFMASGLMTVGIAYVVRIAIARKVGFEATGLYQSAWTLGSLYVGFILQAMGADFYPRLTACANDNPACNRLVNEQAHVGLLLGGPGVVATLTFAPLIIAMFYSTRFGAAVGVLRWICLGTILQVVTWPMGFILVAKARQTLFVLCELAWSIVSLGLAWLCIQRFGLIGAGIAFFGSYIFHGLLLYVIVRKVSGYRWSSENTNNGTVFLLIIAAVFSGFYLLPFAAAESIGFVATILTAIYSARKLTTLVSSTPISLQLKRLVLRLRAPSTAATNI